MVSSSKRKRDSRAGSSSKAKAKRLSTQNGNDSDTSTDAIGGSSTSSDNPSTYDELEEETAMESDEATGMKQQDLMQEAALSAEQYDKTFDGTAEALSTPSSAQQAQSLFRRFLAEDAVLLIRQALHSWKIVSQLLQWFQASMLDQAKSHYKQNLDLAFGLSKRLLKAPESPDGPRLPWASHSCVPFLSEETRFVLDGEERSMSFQHLAWLYHLAVEPRLLAVFIKRAEAGDFSPLGFTEISIKTGRKSRVGCVYMKHARTKFIIGMTKDLRQRDNYYATGKCTIQVNCAKSDLPWNQWQHHIIFQSRNNAPILLLYTLESIYIFLARSWRGGLNINPVDASMWAALLNRSHLDRLWNNARDYVKAGNVMPGDPEALKNKAIYRSLNEGVPRLADSYLKAIYIGTKWRWYTRDLEFQFSGEHWVSGNIPINLLTRKERKRRSREKQSLVDIQSAPPGNKAKKKKSKGALIVRTIFE